MTVPAVDTETMSAECALAQRPDYRDLHADCRQTKDVPLPHGGGGLLLVRRCTCTCHHWGSDPATASANRQAGRPLTGKNN